MAIPFLNNLDITDNQLLNAKLHLTPTPPTAAAAQIYFDSTPSDLTAKYYSNSADQWVSLKEYTFPTDTYITGTVTGTTPKPIITFDLNAIDGVAIAGERYLTKSNTWAEVSGISGTTYDLEGVGSTNGTAGVRLAGSDATNDDVLIIGAGTTTVTRSLNTLTVTSNDQFTGTVTSITAGVGLTGGVITTSGTITLDYNGSDNYIQNNPNGTAIPESDSSINFHSNIDDDVYVTELGAIPVSALTLVKNYIDSSVSGGVYYQGGYNPTTDLTSPGNYGLQTPPNPNIIEIGWMYTVTADGTFFGEQVRVGDVLIAEIDAPTSLSDWTTVQNNIDLATSIVVGLGNVVPGSSNTVTAPYTSGTATLDVVDSTPSQKGAVIVDAGTGISVSYTSGTATVTNTDTNTSNTATGTITAGNLSGTVNHTFGLNTLVQTINSSGDTVYCDVTRTTTGGVGTASTSVATISVAEATDITILVQKIG
jgi:hypothetical protein